MAHVFRTLQLKANVTKTKLIFSAGVLLALLCGLFAANLVAPRALAAGNCDSNSIIYCGFSSASDLIAKARSNDSRNGHRDLQTIFNHYGLQPEDYDRFSRTARPGTLYKDGRLVVDGQVVATNTNTIGRNASAQGRNYFSLKIGGGTYYGNASGATFAAGRESLPAMVMFDAQGAAEFALLTACANPIGMTPIRPSYSCNMLNMNPVAGKLNTYEFSASASVANNASIAKLVYEFGDGSTRTTTSPDTKVTYQYTKAGQYTARVTVYVKVPGQQQVTVSAGACQRAVTVVLPFYQCLQTVGALVNQNDKYRYAFRTNLKYGAGTTLQKITYNFGDGATASTTNADGSITHAYPKGGNYTVKATAYFTVPGRNGPVSATSAGCQMQAPVAQPTYSCTNMATPVVDGTNKLKYNFTSKADVSNGATVVKYVYTFGDGTTDTSTKANGAITHEYKKAGTYTARVTVYVDRKGMSQTSVSSAACQQKLTVISPYYSCLQLSGSIIDQSKYSYKFIATAQYGNGAKIGTATFDFGDGKTQTGVAANGSTFTVDHTYAAAGNYSVKATLDFTANGENVTAPACTALVTPTTPPTSECKPGIPTGSPLCTPCAYDASQPADSPNCVAPPATELPNTGAGNVVAIAGVMAVAGFMIYRQFIYRNHKRAFYAAEIGSSPLPLGQPLSDEPLQGTPLETRRTFRRKRLF